MKRSAIIVLCLLAASSALGADCKTKDLSKTALELLRPLMELRIKQNAEQFTEEGRWRGESQYTAEVEKRFYSLLADRTPTGDEAVAYLLTVYMGEHPGEELVCEVINRGKRMLPLITTYRECPPKIGVEPLPKFVQGSGFLQDEAEKSILKGEACNEGE